MRRNGLWGVLKYLVPGLVFGIAVLAWGAFHMRAPRHAIVQWQADWFEPGESVGEFHRWRPAGSIVVGETEIWPHLHRRANAWVRSREAFGGDVLVRLRVRFLRGRYLGCYLCFDPDAGNGYWLATGHDVGDNANQAYIKILRNHEWTVVAQAPLEIVLRRQYEFAFQRLAGRLVILVDGMEIVGWNDDMFESGHVQLRLHNSQVEIEQLLIKQAARLD